MCVSRVHVPVHIIHTYMYMCTCVQVGVPYRVHMVPVGTVFLLVVTVLVVCCGRQQHRFPGDSSSTAKRHLLDRGIALGGTAIF